MELTAQILQPSVLRVHVIDGERDVRVAHATLACFRLVRLAPTEELHYRAAQRHLNQVGPILEVEPHLLPETEHIGVEPHGPLDVGGSDGHVVQSLDHLSAS